jgi:hypothetical protein
MAQIRLAELQHFAPLKCERIATAVADGDTREEGLIVRIQFALRVQRCHGFAGLLHPDWLSAQVIFGCFWILSK